MFMIFENRIYFYIISLISYNFSSAQIMYFGKFFVLLFVSISIYFAAVMENSAVSMVSRPDSDSATFHVYFHSKSFAPVKG